MRPETIRRAAVRAARAARAVLDDPERFGAQGSEVEAVARVADVPPELASEALEEYRAEVDRRYVGAGR